MATIKQVFGNMKKGLATGNFTLNGLVQTLQHYSEELENATGDSASQDYSTNEHIIGKWIDNKTIYRRVITGTKTTNSPEVVASGLTFIDTLIKISITFKGNTSSLIGQYFESSNDNGRCWIEGDGDLYISSGTSYPVQPYTYTIIIEYTK